MPYDDSYAYLDKEDLLVLLDADTRDSDEREAIPPDLRDLARLHRAIRDRMSFTVLEFGIGYSTLVICDALAKNESQWRALESVPKIRNRFMWQAFSVDTSQRWIDEAIARIPESLRSRLHTTCSPASVATFRGQLCHYYKELPDIVPDFVYLDGPDPAQVTGSINGLSFSCPERTVLAADLILMESTLLPGTYILVDGRTSNARFLLRNFQRAWHHSWSPDEDITTFELNEDRLGRHNILGLDYRP